MEANFVAIKVGDVNLSATPNFQSIDDRSNPLPDHFLELENQFFNKNEPIMTYIIVCLSLKSKNYLGFICECEGENKIALINYLIPHIYQCRKMFKGSSW